MTTSVETNELSKKAMGGTELMLKRLHDSMPTDLISKFQIIPSRVRDLDPNKKKIFWVHDLPYDPEVKNLSREQWEQFDAVVFVSHWQQCLYNVVLGVPYDKGIVIPNAITPIEEHTKPVDKLRLIYTPTPHRGLNILQASFEKLYEEFGDVLELDVYSSFKLYGWEERDKQYQELFDRLKNQKGVNYHGSVSNDKIRDALKKAHIFAYPSTWQETSCLCLIEAMSAGCYGVHSSLAALPETSMGLTMMYQYFEDQNHHAHYFHNTLRTLIQYMLQGNNLVDFSEDVDRNYCNDLVPLKYDWNSAKAQWEVLLQSLDR